TKHRPATHRGHDLCHNHKPYGRAYSSVGQSSRLIIDWSQVQVLLGPPSLLALAALPHKQWDGRPSPSPRSGTCLPIRIVVTGSTPLTGDQGIRQTRLITPSHPH